MFWLDWRQTWKDEDWFSNDRSLSLFQKWIKGKTGNPMVDASMRELASTGFMSNRGRLVVSFFLVYDLQGQFARGDLRTSDIALTHTNRRTHSHTNAYTLVDWRWGAEYFEKVLVDHDVCLNWGNWHGNLGTKGKFFSKMKDNLKIISIDWKFQKYDPKGRYVRHWIPGLRCVPEKFVHEPWNWPEGDKLRESPDGYFVCGDDSISAAARPAFSPKSRKELKRSIDLCLSQSPVCV